MIISAFPGTGKTHLFNKLRDKINIADSDSSQFDKTRFPENYIEHIKDLSANGTRVLCSSHQTVRDALVKNGMFFVLVYPHHRLRDEYLRRYALRKSPSEFIDLMRDNWYTFIDSCAEQQCCTKIVLSSGQYLDDVLALG